MNRVARCEVRGKMVVKPKKKKKKKKGKKKKKKKGLFSFSH